MNIYKTTLIKNMIVLLWICNPKPKYKFMAVKTTKQTKAVNINSNLSKIFLSNIFDIIDLFAAFLKTFNFLSDVPSETCQSSNHPVLY